MTEKKQINKQNRKSYTPWHVYLSDILEAIADEKEIEVKSFVKLGTLPLESDIILIRKKRVGDFKFTYPDMEFLLPYLGKYTLIEYKSPLDTLTFDDFDLIRAYKNLIKRKFEIDYDKDVNVICLASQFQKNYAVHFANNGYKYKKIEEGVHGHSGDNRKFYLIDLGKIGKKYPENIINLLSSNFRNYKTAENISKIRNIDKFIYILQNLFKNKEGTMNNIAMRQYPEFRESMDVIRKKFIESLEPEERLAGIGAKERLAGIGAKERLAGIKLEDMIAALGPEQLQKIKKMLDERQL